MRAEYYLILVVAAMALVCWRIVRRMREKMQALDRAREQIQEEETRVFDFLHGLGEAFSADHSAEDLHRLIVDGAMRIVDGHGGALYLPQLKGDGLRRSYGTVQDSVIFEVPEEAAKSPDLLRTFLRWHSVAPGAGLIGEVWERGEPLNVRSDHPQLQKPGAPATAMVAPLIFNGQKLGLLLVTRRAGSEPFLGTTFQIFKTIAEQSAYALFTTAIFAEAAEKRRMDEDLVVANEIQRIMLPARAPTIAGYQISGVNLPAKQVSGDYYDYIAVDPGHVGVVIADVSGKGVPASLIMAMCRSVLRSQAGGQISPAGVLRAVNTQLFPDIKEDMFISMAYAVLDAQNSTIALCRAGHDAPLLYRAKDKTVSRINPPGMALGIDDGGVFNRVANDFSITLEKDDCLILYTDGVSEALDPRGEEFGLEKIVESIQASAGEGAAAIISRLTDDVRAFIGPHPQNDDITLIAIRKQ